MARGRISKRTVDAIRPHGTDVYLWDDQLRGFGLKVTPSGSKTFVVQYRLNGRIGRTRRVKIGTLGALTADQARAQAKKLLGSIATGGDPAEERTRLRAQMSLGVVVDLFLEQHVDAKLKATSAAEYHRLLRLHVPPALRSRALVDVQRSDIAKLHLSLRDKPYQANRLLAVLSKVFSWADLHGLRSEVTNPCRHIDRFRERKRQRFLTEPEIARLGNALAKAERDRMASPWAIAAIWLLILTGARLSEIRTLRWSDVDLTRRRLMLPDSKTDEKMIHLSGGAIDVLRSLPRQDNNPYVICGDKAKACLVNLQKPWRRIRHLAGLDDVRIHDLRHTFASVAAAQGVSLQMIGGLLGHANPATTARYAHLADEKLAETNDEIGASIATSLQIAQPRQET